MKFACALVCAALALYPALASAEIKPAIQVPPGWTTRATNGPHDHAWWRGEQFLDLDTQANGTRRTLRAYVHDIILPSSNTNGERVVSNGPTTSCAGRQPAWLLTISMPAEPGKRAVLEVVVAVDGAHAYEAAYMRRSTDPPRPDAERAIRSLCLNRT